jgi:hypothetical protein
MIWYLYGDPNGIPRKYAIDYVWYPWTSTFDDTAIRSSLSNRLASRIRVAASDLRFNLGQALAERRQTVNLVANTAVLLAKAYKDIRRGRVPVGLKHVSSVDWSKKASNIWLQYHYGWLPLLSDIHGALTLLVERPLTFEISATVKDSDTKSFDFHQMTNSGMFHVTGKANVGYKMRGNAKVLIEDYGRTESLINQLGANNPALLGWELLPYSFVVDWFLNIGTYLEALNGFNGVTILDSCTTFTRHFDMYAVSEKTKNDLAIGQTVLSNSIAQGTDTVITRTLGLPSLTLPALETKLSLTKLVTSLALLKQAFSR